MNFLFDIGRVLLDFDFEASLRRLLPEGDDIDRRLAPLLERKDEFEAGRIPLDDYLDLARDTLGPAVSRDAFIAAWREIFTPNLPMWDCVRRLHGEGHRLVLFSNINPIHWPWIAETYEIFELFPEGILSFEIGAVKPHDPMYRHAVEQLGLRPAETLYLDDLPDNIATGRRFGFHCHQYDLRRHRDFEAWLDATLASVV